jgi:hypothetical protein
MYIAGANNVLPTSEPAQRPGGFGTVYKGAMSKRFDGKEDMLTAPKNAPVRPMSVNTTRMGILSYSTDNQPFSKVKCSKRGRGCGYGCNVPGSDCQLGRDSRKDVTVGLALPGVLSS